MTKGASLLEGKWFNMMNKKANDKCSGCWVVENQGQVLGRIDKRRYLLQMYDGISDEPSDQRIATARQMNLWWFYDTKALRDIALIKLERHMGEHRFVHDLEGSLDPCRSGPGPFSLEALHSE